MEEAEFELVSEEEDEEAPDPAPWYPVKSASDDERRRAWVLEMLCTTPEGPVFDKMVDHAAAVEAYLIGGKPAPQPKPRPVK
jgi:hypothetical protein